VKAQLGEGSEEMDEGEFIEKMQQMEMNIRSQRKANMVSKWFHLIFFGFAIVYISYLAGNFLVAGMWVPLDQCRTEKYAHLCEYCIGPYGDHMLCYGQSLKDRKVD